MKYPNKSKKMNNWNSGICEFCDIASSHIMGFQADRTYNVCGRHFDLMNEASGKRLGDMFCPYRCPEYKKFHLTGYCSRKWEECPNI